MVIELKKCIIQSQEAVLYIWSPRCKGKHCYSLDLLQAYCNKKKIDLFIVAEYYDLYLMNQKYNIDKPIFGIDTKFYKTDVTSQYLHKFVFDLTQQHQNYIGKFFRFQDGNFINSIESIDSL
jgi:hypothetical protein